MQQSSNGIAALVSALAIVAATTGMSLAAEPSYPTNWGGAWSHDVNRAVEVQGTFDQTKAWGPGQQAPLTPEYQKVLADSMADQAAGGLGNYPTSHCLPSGMPRMMTFGSKEYVITPETTYILLSGSDHLRRIFTDGRDWPKDPKPTFGGYSIGHWLDEDGDGVYDTLEVETRYFKGPRAYDATGLPLAFDNESVFKERFYLDKSNPDIMHIVTTVFDHALTRPWTVDRQFNRIEKHVVQWRETWCQEGNANIVIGKENYWLRADGLLMPARKGQTGPDLRYFQQSQK
jgi:hypothetical protein